jgi:hemerythrin-like domain-containing protein
MRALKVTAPDFARVAERLRSEHILFDRRFEELCERADGGDWRDLDAVWGRFSEDLEQHLDFEEDQVFPPFAARGPDCRSLSEALVAQHMEIRALLDVLGLQIQLKEIRAATIHAFTELLHKHAAVENAQIYPWIEDVGLWAAHPPA